MSTQVECPLCKHVSKRNSHPHPNWGDSFTEVDLERLTMLDYETGTIKELAGRLAYLLVELGKETFWCPCGLAVWMGGVGWLAKIVDMPESIQ